MNWINEIDKERKRQIVEKGYTSEHDDIHENGEIANHAASLATTDIFLASQLYPYSEDIRVIKQKDRKIQLVKAGALILAELERLERLDK